MHLSVFECFPREADIAGTIFNRVRFLSTEEYSGLSSTSNTFSVFMSGFDFPGVAFAD
jgi:hypothetical protein